MSRSRRLLRGLALCVCSATLHGCAAHGGPQNTFDNCRTDALLIRIEIGIDLFGTETLHGSGAFTKDFLTHKAGEPCDYTRSVSFEDAARFLAGAGYTVERSGSRLTVSAGTGAAKLGDASAAGEIQRTTLSVLYAGRILEHNADRVDAATQELTWELEPAKPRPIRFVLEVP
jgi:hypothetical protein